MSFFKKYGSLLKIIGLYLSPIACYFISVFFIYLLIQIYDYGHINKIIYALSIIIPVACSLISLVYGIINASIYKNKYSEILGMILMGIGLIILLGWIITLFIILPWVFLGFF